MASAFKSAVAQEISDQPTWLRYKASIIIVVTGVLTIITQLATSPDLADTWLAPVLTAVATSGAFVLNRFTKDGLTPSMGPKIEAAAQRFYSDIPFETAPSYTPQPDHTTQEVPMSGAGNLADGLAAGAAARARVEQQAQRWGNGHA